MLKSLVKKFCKILVSPLKTVLSRALTNAYSGLSELDNSSDIVNMVPDAEGNSIALTTKVPRDLEQDFLDYRSATYFKPMTDGVAQEFALLLLRENKPQKADVIVLQKMFLHSAGALLTEWSEEEECFVSDFSVFHAPVWKGYYQEIEYFKCNPSKNFYRIIDKAGKVYSPDDSDWETAVNHLVAAYTVGIPVASHNWVHFCYPELMGAAVFHTLTKGSVLYRLLHPHVRFTNRINYQVLWVQKSTNNTPSMKDKLVPWKSFPIYADDFRFGVLKNTYKHYQQIEQHFANPQGFDQRIPYYGFLKKYYEVIERFTKSVEFSIDADEYQRLAIYVDEYLPGFKKIEMRRALATLIWQVSVLHGTEHFSYFDLAKVYGFSEIKTPISTPLKLENVSLYNRFKLRCFLNIFVIFNPNPKLNQQLSNVSAYQFSEGSKLGQCANQFRLELKALDNELRSKDQAIIALDNMVQSVCY